LKRAGVRTSLFIAPSADAVQRSRDLGADAIELHTGAYAHHAANAAVLRALAEGAAAAAALGLGVHAGHGLTVRNVGPRGGDPGDRRAEHRTFHRESRDLRRAHGRGAGDARGDGRGSARFALTRWGGCSSFVIFTRSEHG